MDLLLQLCNDWPRRAERHESPSAGSSCSVPVYYQPALPIPIQKYMLPHLQPTPIYRESSITLKLRNPGLVWSVGGRRVITYNPAESAGFQEARTFGMLNRNRHCQRPSSDAHAISEELIPHCLPFASKICFTSWSACSTPVILCCCLTFFLLDMWRRVCTKSRPLLGFSWSLSPREHTCDFLPFLLVTHYAIEISFLLTPLFHLSISY